MAKIADRFTAADRAMLHEVRDMVAELRAEGADIKRRLDVLERPRVAKVIFDPARFQGPDGGAAQR
jgi:hypothetical protein